MKRQFHQFIHIPAAQGKQLHEQQTEEQPVCPPVATPHPQERIDGKGLLSNWKARQTQNLPHVVRSAQETATADVSNNQPLKTQYTRERQQRTTSAIPIPWRAASITVPPALPDKHMHSRLNSAPTTYIAQTQQARQAESFARHHPSLLAAHNPATAHPGTLHTSPSRPLPTPEQGRQRPVQRRHRSMPAWGYVILTLLVVLLGLSGLGYAYYQINYASSISDITGQQAIRDSQQSETGKQIAGEQQTPGSSLAGSQAALSQPTNIVLLGSDTDGKNNSPQTGMPLAQTIIIISIDPQHGKVGMFSIPRDMQVSDLKYASSFPAPKIDQVFQHAWQGASVQERAARAAGHMMSVIESNYGIHIDHYAWVGLQGFVRVIDTVGGVDIDVTHPIFDDVYPDDVNNPDGNVHDYKRLYIAAGPQHLNGEQALEYVRTRHSDLIGDFGRTARQQQVLTQLKTRLQNIGTVNKMPVLLKELDGYLQTDMDMAYLGQLAQYAHNINMSNIEHTTLGPPTYAYMLDMQQGNFAPNCPQVLAAIQHMFNVQGNCIPQTSGFQYPETDQRKKT